MAQDSITKSLLKLSIPIVMANTLHSAYQLTDTFWVGRLGAEAVAAVSVCYPVIFVLLSLGMGFSVAGTVLVSQYSGKGDQKMIDFVTGQTFFVMTIISLTFSAIGYYFSDVVVHAMGVSGEVATQAISYMEISFIGLFFMYAYLTFQNILRGVGNVKTPFYIVLITVLLNFIADPLFIMGYGPIPAMGVAGAAVATIATQAIAAIIGTYFLINGKHGIRLRLNNLVPNFNQIKKIILLGSPAGAEQSSRGLSMTLMTFLVTGFGTQATAVFGIGIRILSFVIIPALGFSQATSTLVGQSIGAGNKAEAIAIGKRSITLIAFFLTLAGVIMFMTSVPIIKIFVPDSPEVISEGSEFVRIIALTFGFIGIQQVISGALRGGGNTTLAMLLAIVSLWVFRFPIAYILAYHTKLQMDGIWWAFASSNIIAGALSIIVFSRSNWIKNLVDDEEKIENKVIDEIMTEEL